MQVEISYSQICFVFLKKTNKLFFLCFCQLDIGSWQSLCEKNFTNMDPKNNRGLLEDFWCLNNLQGFVILLRAVFKDDCQNVYYCLYQHV